MKNMLRQKILQKRKEMSVEERQRESNRIVDILCASQSYQRADTVFTYISMEEEINTYPLIKRAWQDGKTVAVPIAKIRGEMYFVPIAAFSELKKSHFGVMEPQKGKTEEVLPKKTDFFLVPGSVFDQKGNRYGYGGGYYDRYFHQYPNIYKIAAAFSFQVMEFELQAEVFDVPVDCIVTEKGVIGGSNDECFD